MIMAKPKVLIFRTAGINCDKETVFAFEKAGAKVQLSHISEIRPKKALACQIVCIPGGFSYGDDLGAGKILSLEIGLWLKDQIKAFFQKGGLILGICNGFQVLAKAGMLPDFNFKQKVSLLENSSGRFESRWVGLEVNPDSAAKKIWLKNLPDKIELPAAHKEGKFYCLPKILSDIEKNNQVALRYSLNCRRLSYPDNPNGSLNDIAGISDKTGRIFGLMPHPERFIFSHQHPCWVEKNGFVWGLEFFKNSVNYFK